MADPLALPEVVFAEKATAARLASAAWISEAAPFLPLAVWPLGMLLLNGRWIFTPIAFIDGWIYLGYMLDLPGHLRSFPGLYYGTRLSWLLPGSLLYHFLPPLLADYSLHLIAYYTATFATFFTFHRTIGFNAALVTAILMASTSSFVRAVGWDYVDGAGIAYVSLTLLCLTRAAGSRFWPWWNLFAGFFLAATITTYTFLTAFLPCFALVFLWANSDLWSNWRAIIVSLVQRVSMLALGVLALITVLGTYNWTIGGDFLYFLPAFSFAAQWLAIAEPYGVVTYDWVLSANWLFVPVIVTVASIALLVTWLTTRTVQRHKYEALFCATFLLALAIMLASELSGKHPVLRIDYYASYIIPWTFLAVGAVLAPLVAGLTPRHLLIVVGSAVLGLVLSANAHFDLALSSVPSVILIVSALSLICLAVAANAVRKRFIRNGVALACCAVFVFGLTFWNGNVTVTTLVHSDIDIYAVVVDGYKVLAADDPQVQMRLWYDASAPEGDLAESLASTYLWAYRLIGIHFPSTGGPLGDVLGQNATGLLVPGARVAILSNDVGAIDKAHQSVSALQVDFDVESVTTVHHGARDLTITIIRIAAPQSAATPTRS